MVRPINLSSDVFVRVFLEICNDRYPSSSKVLSATERRFPGLSTSGKIIIISQFRDAVKEVPPNQVYRSLQHRDEVHMAIIEALEDLEDTLEDEEEKEQEITKRLNQ